MPDDHNVADDITGRWSEALRVADEDLDLGFLAALIAKAEYPDLDVAETLQAFDDLASEVTTAGDGLDALRQVLFVEHGFSGNTRSYYEPTNSYINDVLRLKTGIPITLCVLLLEVGARCGQPLAPVSFPGHFLARKDRADGDPEFIDAFEGGAVQARADLEARLRQLAGRDDLPEAFISAAFAPCSKREVVARMLRNLKQIYLHKQDWPRALRVTDQLLHVQPGSGEHYRDRGQLYAQIGHFAAAHADLSRYLQMVADPKEKARVREVLGALAGRDKPLN